MACASRRCEVEWVDGRAELWQQAKLAWSVFVRARSVPGAPRFVDACGVRVPPRSRTRHLLDTRPLQPVRGRGP
eukprot:2169929-Prymnesium_polylepis.1